MITTDSIHASKGQVCVCVTGRERRANWLQNNLSVEQTLQSCNLFHTTLPFLSVFIHVAIILIITKSGYCSLEIYNPKVAFVLMCLVLWATYYLIVPG